MKIIAVKIRGKKKISGELFRIFYNSRDDKIYVIKTLNDLINCNENTHIINIWEDQK